MNLYSYVGLVRNQTFEILYAEDERQGSFQLTTTPVGGPDSAEAGRIPLIDSDGLVLLVRGIAADGWIHSAALVDKAGGLAGVVAQKAFGRKPTFSVR